MVKVLSNDDGANATFADFPLTATGPATVSGVTPVASAVPAGDYVLSEPVVAGYVSVLGFECDGGTAGDSSVTLVNGDNVTCTIINDDEPIDLEITKDDGGFEAVAGGAPFDYTISVRNIGTRDADLSEPVTVTDELPIGLVWVSFPATCEQNGQTLTCDIDPSLMTAGGDAVVITATVEAPADTPSGVFENKSYVTTEDDPVCEGDGCNPPPCDDIADNNNVDCEETPVDREGGIQIIKIDDVDDGVSVLPGETFSYSLVVTNTGVSTLLPGTAIDDELPPQLALVSVVGGVGWTCNNSDPIECSYAPELAPGQSAPSVVVTVQVNVDAITDSIVNIATTNGAVDRDCTTEPTNDLVESHFESACNEVTDDDDETTPLIPNADLAIIKTASVAQVGTGGGFDWILDITNNGPATAINVVIGDIVPNDVTVTGVTSSDFVCTNVGNSVSCTVASLALGGTGQAVISVTVPIDSAGGAVNNLGTVVSDTPDPDITNNSDDASVALVAQIPPTTVVLVIPKTGSDTTGSITGAAFALVLIGGLVLLIARRRREDDFETA